MQPPPRMIDGANVLMYADVGGLQKTSAVRHYNENGLQESFSQIAICTYGSEDEIYLFHCDKDWETENDDLFRSWQDAIDSAINQYAGLKEKDFVLYEKTAQQGDVPEVSGIGDLIK